MENLDLQQLERLFFLLIGGVVLTLIALVVYVIVANRRQRARMARAQEDDGLAPRPALQVTGQILSLVRDTPGSPLQVEIGGGRYHRLADIDDPQVKRQVMDAAMELIQFTGVLGADVVAPAPIEKTHSWREDLREDSQAELERLHPSPAQEEAQPPAPPEVEEQFLNLLAEMGQALTQPEKPGIVSSLQRALRPRPLEPDRPHTFVDDIEDIVQRRVQLIPALAGRELHVRAGPGGAVRFWFEGREYASVDDVPNLTARQLIKDAIQEWDETT